MIPQKLTISGFLSYQQATEIDFSPLHVACISGQNGAGKSAMLDAMTWALFGEARKNDESVINDALTKKKAEVIFDFEYENALYRIVRSRELGKPSAVDFFIFEAESGNWHPLSEKRVTDTNKRICDVLHMDYKTFINASFFLQGKADQFTSQNAAERKQILSNILDLDVWELYKDQTIEKRKNQAGQLALIDSQLQEAESELAQEEQRRADLAAIEAQSAQAAEKRSLAAQTWQNAKDAEQNMLAQKKLVSDLQAQDTRLFQQIEQNKRTLTSRQTELDTCNARLKDAEKIQADYAALISVRKTLTEMDAKAQRFYQLDRRAAALRNTIDQEKLRLEAEIKTLEQTQRDVQTRQQDIPQTQTQLDQLQREIESLQLLTRQKQEWISKREQSINLETEKKAENKNLRAQMEELKTHIDSLQKQVGGLCPVCGREMDEQHCTSYAAQLQEEGTSKAAAYHANQDEVHDLEEQRRQIAKKIQEIEAAESRSAQLAAQAAPLRARSELAADELQKWQSDGAGRLAKAHALLESPDFCQQEQTELTETQSAIAANAYDEQAHQSWRAKEKQLASSESALQSLQQAQGAAAPLQREIEELGKKTEAANQEWLALRVNLTEQEKQLQTLQENIPDLIQAKKALDAAQLLENTLLSRKGSAEQLVAVLASVKEKRVRLTKERTETGQLIERLKLLEKAFGKNGIPALLIEQALPEIEEQANLILGRLSDDRMSLHFESLRAYKDKKKEEKKETLDILISDDYGTRAYELFSGGEAFRINFAIRLALSRLLARRSGSRLQTLVIDEGFGSQDADGRERLIDAITTVQDDFEKILVITHLDELKDAFPSRIEVEKTVQGSKVEVYP